MSDITFLHSYKKSNIAIWKINKDLIGLIDPEFEFQMVDQRKWKAQLNEIFS